MTSGQAITSRPSFRFTKQKLKIFLLALAVVLVAGAYALSHPTHDFLEYWAAAHLLIQHKNPYSLVEMVQAEQSFGWKFTDPIMFVGPPWALPLILPLSLFTSYALAWTIWVSVLIATVAFSSRLLMDIYFGELRIPEVTDTSFNRCLFAFTFYPILLCLQYAQTTPFILLGLAGFLFFDSKNRPFAAGVLLSLTLIKPQLLFLVWLAVLLRAIQSRQWKLLGLGDRLNSCAQYAGPDVRPWHFSPLSRTSHRTVSKDQYVRHDRYGSPRAEQRRHLCYVLDAVYGACSGVDLVCVLLAETP